MENFPILLTATLPVTPKKVGIYTLKWCQFLASEIIKGEYQAETGKSGYRENWSWHTVYPGACNGW